MRRGRSRPLQRSARRASPEGSPPPRHADRPPAAPLLATALLALEPARGGGAALPAGHAIPATHGGAHPRPSAAAALRWLLDRQRRWFLLGCVAFTLAWYPLLERLLAPGGAGGGLFRPALLGLAFNAMAEHLLAGRFDIDPAAIGFEAFVVDGRTVSYFGIFCALLRLPLVLTPGLAGVDVTRLSCLLALCLGAWFQLRAVLLARDAAAPGPRRDALIAALLLCVLFGGAQVQFLRATIYQEVINWAAAFAMGFVFLALRGLLSPRGFDRRTLCGMAAFAGLALLTRVSFGAGLYAALVLLLPTLPRPIRRGALPCLILLGFAAAAGVVNQGRWGDPLVFADFSRYALSQDVFPDRLHRLAAFGSFHPARIGLGLSYYFLPLWALPAPGGGLWFEAARARLIDSMELPPASFILSDPLLLALAALGLAAAVGGLGGALRGGRGGGLRAGPAAHIPGDAPPPGLPDFPGPTPSPAHPLGPRPGALSGLALLAGLAVPPVLMLCAISMSYRYRMEFFPFLTMAGLLGVGRLCRRGGPRRLTPRAGALIGAAVVVSLAASHMLAALYLRAPWGPAEQYLATQSLRDVFRAPVPAPNTLR